MKTFAGLAIAAVVLVVFALMSLQGMIAISKPKDLSDLRGNAQFRPYRPSPDTGITPPAVQNFEARDRALIGYRFYRSSKPTTTKLYLVHSEAWDELELAGLASGLARAGAADVLTLDLRGHGENPVRRGDLNYRGQLEDDLADLIAKTAGSGDRVVVGGHSTGAAVAARLATGPNDSRIKGLILIAPLLTRSFPGVQADFGGWLMPLSTRVLSLKIENMFGIHWSDHEVAVQYAVPSSVRGEEYGYAITSDYTWRLFKSMQLRHADGSDLQGLKAPLLFVSGESDEMLDGAAAKAALQALVKNGEYASVTGETHFSVANSAKTLAIVQNWLAKLR